MTQRRAVVGALPPRGTNGQHRPNRPPDAPPLDQLLQDAMAWLRRERMPTWGIDRLLTHPFVAASLAMAIDAGPAEGARIESAARELIEWARTHSDVVERIDRVCKDLMNIRKAGKNTCTAPSPATRAAATRK